MRKYLVFLYTILLAVAFLMNPTASKALSLDAVGGVDNFIDNTSLGDSGDQTEIDWVNSVLGTNFTKSDFTKETTNEGAGWAQIDSSKIYAYDVSDISPEYFLVKIGAKPDAPDTFLYENIGDLGWAVINLEGTDFTIKNIGKLSHIDTFSSNPVPEPATMLLLGTGLVGIAGISRKFKK